MFTQNNVLHSRKISFLWICTILDQTNFSRIRNRKYDFQLYKSRTTHGFPFREKSVLHSSCQFCFDPIFLKSEIGDNSFLGAMKNWFSKILLSFSHLNPDFSEYWFLWCQKTKSTTRKPCTCFNFSLLLPQKIFAGWHPIQRSLAQCNLRFEISWLSFCTSCSHGQRTVRPSLLLRSYCAHCTLRTAVTAYAKPYFPYCQHYKCTGVCTCAP